jgi:spore germination protein GerM
MEGRRSWRSAVPLAAALVAVIAGCSHKPPPAPVSQVAVYFCKAGTDTLVPTRFTVDPNLDDGKLESLLVDQLIAGPANGRDDIVLFPAGTTAATTLAGATATVDFGGAMTKEFRGGASDEVALFKALAYTVTSVPGVSSVKVLVGGRTVATLPGGEFEIDEPLGRETFSQ